MSSCEKECHQEDTNYTFQRLVCDPAAGTDFVVLVNGDGHEKLIYIDERHNGLCFIKAQQPKPETKSDG